MPDVRPSDTPDHGFDVALHSASEYLDGHDDVVGARVIGQGVMAAMRT